MEGGGVWESFAPERLTVPLILAAIDPIAKLP